MRTLVERAAEDMNAKVARTFGAELASISQQLHAGRDPAGALAAYLAFARQHASKTLPAIDAWDYYEGLGLAQAMTNHPSETLKAFEKSREAAAPLAYGMLQESQFNVACALASTGDPDGAIAALGVVLWEDAVTSFDRSERRRPAITPRPRSRTIRSPRSERAPS